MKRIIYLLLLILIIIILYSIYISPNIIKIKEYTLNNTSSNIHINEIKISHISDILYKKDYNIAKLDEYIDKINNTKSNIVFFTGDLINKDYKLTKKDIKLLEEKLSKIKPSLYKFAILGDYDLKEKDTITNILKNSNFIILDNSNFEFYYKDNNPINIMGINNDFDINTINNNYDMNLLLIHNPEMFDKLIDKVDYIFAGHTLNGQVRLPVYGAINIDKIKYIDSYYKNSNTSMYISNGLGNKKYEIRYNNNPTINIYRFKK